MSEYSLTDAAGLVGVTPATLRRWQRDGLIPQYDEAAGWTGPAVAHARIVARLRSRGHSLSEIRAAGESGRLAFGFVDDLLPEHHEPGVPLAVAAAETGLEPALVERIVIALGLGSLTGDEHLSPEDVELLRYAARVLEAGFPLVAFLQLARVYGQSIAQIADAEVRLFHLYVHEPLMRDGVPGTEIAEQMSGLAERALPLATPILERLHRRFLAHFVEQDIIGHMESDSAGGGEELGRLRVAIAFADLAGYTRLTEEQGDQQALDVVESFVEAVEDTLPEEARVVKMLGDEVMIVGADASALTEWAVGFQTLWGDRSPQPRIGVHHGEVLYRDGDYYGREVNRASRVVARAAAGEVLVTRPIVEQESEHLDFNLIGEVKLKGFNEPSELFHARPLGEDAA